MNAYFVLTSFLPFLISADAQCKCSDLQWIFNSSNTIEDDGTTTTETVFTSKPEQTITNYRLPTSLIPIHYDLELKPSFNHPNFIFDGKVAIWFKCTQATNQIILHSHSLHINTITVSSDDYERNITITNFIHDISRDFLIIDLTEYLKVGEEYTIWISFSGVLNEYYDKGFVLSYYNAHKDGRNSRRYLAVTHFEPFSARSAFPCFDEPQLKATFNMSIIRLSNMTAISNMPLLRSSKQDLWIVDDFKKSPKMSTYLVAVVVSDLAHVEVQAGNTIVRIWVRRGLENSTKLISSAVPIILKYMEEYTEIPYVLPKLDIIGVPKSRPGAMENWGLIRFYENYLLYNATLDTNPSVITYLIHEIVHQWFGNLITIKWWNDLWLKEGLSTYITSLICPLIKDNPDKQSCLPSSLNSASNFFRIMYFEMDSRSHALSPNPNLLSADQIESTMFSRISYQKGAIIIRMMELFAGKEVLRKGLLKYLLANMYGNADRYNLYQHISQELNVSGIEDINVKEIMDTWVLQQGIPIVTVTRNYLSNTAFVRQKVFQEKNSEVNFNKDNKWAIPLTFTTKYLKTFDVKSCKWMHNEEFVQLTTDDGLPTKDEWVLFNPSLHGYYIVNYDNRNWKLLINQLIEDNTKFPLEVRLHLFQTLDVLKRNNIVPHHVTDYMFEYIRNEQNQYILIMGLREILNLFYIFKPTLHFHLFRKYLLHVLTPIWNHFKLTETTEKYHEEFKVLLYQLACKAGVKECVEEIIRRIHDSIDAKTFTKYVDKITVCSAMSEMPKEKWEEFWSLRNKIPKTVATYSHKINIQNLFSCTENPYLILKVLNTVLDQISINRHHSTSVFMSAIDNHYFSRQLAFKVFKENLQKFLDWFEIKPIIKEFFLTATTQHDIDEVKSIISCIPQSVIKGDENNYRKMIIKSQKQFEIRKNIILVNYNWLELVTQNFLL